MKLLIGVLILLSAGSMWQVHAYVIEDIERFWTAAQENSYLFAENRSEPSQYVFIKKAIDNDHPLLLKAVITSSGGKKMYSGDGLDVCKKYNVRTWDFLAVHIFNRGILPGSDNPKCPIAPQSHEIFRFQKSVEVYLAEDVPYDKYVISYVVTSADNEVVFSTLKFKFARHNHVKVYELAKA